MTDIVGEISAATQEQNEGISQVHRAVTQMDETTQQNAALVEQTAAAAKTMREQADTLERAVSVFTIASGKQARMVPKPVQPRQAPRLAAKAQPKLKAATAGDDWEAF